MSTDFTNPNAQPFVLEAGDSAILLIHGFTGSPAHVRIIGDTVHAAGFSTEGILLPGHCTTLEDMAKSTGAQWLDACREAYLRMTKKYRRVAVGGLSLGGVLALLLAEEFDPACVVLFAAAMKYKNAVNNLSPVAKHLVKTLPWRERPYSPEEFLYAYDIGYAGTPVAKVEDMTRLQKRAREGLSGVTCPVLAFQSHLDGSVHHTAPELIMRGVTSRVKEISWVDRSPHVLTLGPDREYVCGRVIDFLRRYAV